MKLILLISIFLQFETFSQNRRQIKRNESLLRSSEKIDEEVVILGEDKGEKFERLKKRKKQLLDLANKQSKDFSADVSVDLYQMSFFNLGTEIKTKSLKLKESHHDASKVVIIKDEEREGIPRWVRTSIGVKALIPISLHVGATFFGNVGVSAWTDNRIEVKRKFELVTHSKAIEKPDPSLGMIVGNKLKDTWTGVKSIRLPMSGEKLLKNFPPGAEYSKEFFFSLLTSVGGSAGAVVQAEHKTYALVEGLFRRTAKVHSVGGKSYIQLVFQNKMIKGRDTASGLSTGVTVFQGGPIDLSLNVNILSHHKAKKRTKNIVYDYFIDPDYPEAMKALKKAFHGNITELQKLAVLRHEVGRFKGVTLNQSTNELLDEMIKDLNVGLFIDGTELKSDYAGFKLQKKLGEFFKRQKIENHQTYSKEINTFTGDVNSILGTPIKIEDKRIAMWGIAGRKKQSVELFNGVLQTQQNIEGGNLQNVYVSKVNYRSSIHAKYAKQHILSEALSNMVQLATFKGDLVYLDSLSEMEKRRCAKDLKIDRIGTFYFYNRESGKQFRLDPKEYYRYMGMFIDDPGQSAAWAHEHKRKERIAILNKRIKDKVLNKKHRGILRAKLAFFKQMEKNKLPYYFTNQYDQEELMRKYGKGIDFQGLPEYNIYLYLKVQAIFDSSGGHPYFFDWLNFIYLEQMRRNEQRVDLYSRYEIKSKECQLNYTYLSPTRFSLQNVSAELTR